MNACYVVLWQWERVFFFLGSKQCTAQFYMATMWRHDTHTYRMHLSCVCAPCNVDKVYRFPTETIYNNCIFCTMHTTSHDTQSRFRCPMGTCIVHWHSRPTLYRCCNGSFLLVAWPHRSLVCKPAAGFTIREKPYFILSHAMTRSPHRARPMLKHKNAVSILFKNQFCSRTIYG